MWRFLAASCLLLSGCDPSRNIDATVEVTAPPPPISAAKPWPAEIVAAIPTSSADWPRVTDRPISVEVDTATLCAPAFVKPEDHGPHYVPSIVVRTNPEALDAFRAKQSPMPVGTIVLKEKHASVEALEPAHAFGAMIKREPGYDPENGDWEYVYGTIAGEPTLERGKLATCIACHSAYQNENDYLFRDYLPDHEETAEPPFREPEASAPGVTRTIAAATALQR